MLEPASLVVLNVGTPQPLAHGRGTVSSGIFKFPVGEPIWLDVEGLAGDAQADRQHHGGPDKAVCVYPMEHYPAVRRRLNRQTLGFAAFGENFSVQGLLEGEVCIGDTFRVGTAVQVSQPRQPCFKLGARHHDLKLPLWVQEHGVTGWYFRVLKPGKVRVGDSIEHVERPPGAISVAEANRIMHHDKQDLPRVEQLLALPALSRSWRATLGRRLAGRETSPEARLTGG